MTFPSLNRIVNVQQLNAALSEILPNAPDGTASAPGVAFSGDQTTGLYRNAAGLPVLTAKGADVLVLDPEGLSFPVSSPATLPAGLDILSALTGVFVTPQMFDPDGLIAAGKPCDVAINAALAYLGANGGGVLRLPRSFYYLSAAIVNPYSNVWIIGDGHGASVLIWNATANNQAGIEFTSNSSGVSQYRGGCTDVSLICQGAAQSASAGTFGLATNATNDLCFARVTVKGFANGVGIIGSANTVRLSMIDVTDVMNDAFYVSSPTSQYFYSCTAYQNFAPSGAGFHVQKTGGYQMVNCVTGGSDPTSGAAGGYTSGILIDPPSGSTVQDGQHVNCNFDTSQTAAINIDTTHGGNAINLDFTNCRTGWGSRYGIAINGVNTSGVKFIGGSTARNLQHGVLIQGGYYIEFHAFHARGNGASQANAYSGFVITGGDFISIIGGLSGPYAAQDSSGSFSLTQQYGVNISSTFTGVLRVVGSDLRGNLTSAVVNNTANADIRFTDCIGYTSTNWGSTTMPSGGISVTVAHGLSNPPSNVLLTYAPALDGASWHADATNLYIDAKDAPTADTVINWQARG
ncbi:hypothetical protein HW537_10935 [Asaia siamensis]